MLADVLTATVARFSFLLGSGVLCDHASPAMSALLWFKVVAGRFCWMLQTTGIYQAGMLQYAKFS
jgi:hypothetical protein